MDLFLHSYLPNAMSKLLSSMQTKTLSSDCSEGLKAFEEIHWKEGWFHINKFVNIVFGDVFVLGKYWL